MGGAKIRQGLAFTAFFRSASCALALFACTNSNSAFADDASEQPIALPGIDADYSIFGGEFSGNNDLYYGVAARDWFAEGDIAANARPPVNPPPPPPPPLGSAIIAILDTGADFNHKEFTGRYSPQSTCLAGSSACYNAYTHAGGEP